MPEPKGATENCAQAEQYEDKKRCAGDADSSDENERCQNKPADAMTGPRAGSVMGERHNSGVRLWQPELSHMPQHAEAGI